MNKLVTNIVPIGHNYVPENIKFWSELEKQEAHVMQTVLQHGYEDSRTDPDQSASLRVDGDRLFIKSFRIVEWEDLVEFQVRAEVLDKKWARDEIMPLIQDHAKKNPGKPGLKYPIQGIVCPVTGKIKIIMGHHRAYALFLMGEKIPVLILTKPVNCGGEAADLNAVNMAKARSNPRMKSKQLTMKCAVLHIEQMFQTDPTFNGKNPTGQKPPRRHDTDYDFDDLMDKAFGDSGNFVAPNARGNIYNKWTAGGPKSKLVGTSDESEITSFLVGLELDVGLNKKQNRVPFLEHFDEDKETLIIQTDDNGNNFGGKCWKLAVTHYEDAAFRNTLENKGIKYLSVVGRLYDCPLSLKAVKERRKAFFEQVESYSGLVEKMTGLKLRLVAMPKELKNSKDSNEIREYNKPIKFKRRKKQ